MAVPEVGRISVQMMRRVVVFPAPFLPSRATRSPGSSCRLNRSKISGPLNLRVASCMLIKAINFSFSIKVRARI